MKLRFPIPRATKPTRTESSIADARDDFIIKIDEATLLLHCQIAA
jgi:hypothetical protein